mgnify:CR=1 FL=1
MMEARERYRKEARIDDIEQVLKNGLLDSEGGKLILIVPIKCEKYTRNDKDRAKLFAQLESAFSGILNLENNPSYKDRLAIAAIPIHTVGNATFSRFERTDDGRLPREIYLKNRSLGFRPKDADQPLRYAMSFLLNEFARDTTTSLSGIFTRIDIKELGDFIRDGMKTQETDGIKIYCGRELIMEMPDVVKGNNSYMFRKPDEVTPAPPAKATNDSDALLFFIGLALGIGGLLALIAVPLLGFLMMGAGGYCIYRGGNS